MRPVSRMHPVALVSAAIALAFGVGWVASSVARGRIVAVPSASAAEAKESKEPKEVACIDRAAMEANANLVAQLSEARREKSAADERMRDAETKLAAVASARATPRAAGGDRDEWARMARDGRVRLRTPCTSWSSGRAFGRIGVGRRSFLSSGGAHELRERARAAGLEDGELETLEQAYTRAHARTWTEMRAACEEGKFFKEAIEESGPTSDADKIGICQASLLPNEPGPRAAMRRMAEARAAGTASPGRSAEERVSFALGRSVEVLFEEMTNALGREKAERALDYGVLCTNEITYEDVATDAD